MTPAQQPYYFALWKNACTAQGWTTANGWTTKQIDAKRKAIHTELFGSPISSKDINTKEQFGLIKSKFLQLADNIKGAIELEHPELDHARRLRSCIKDLFKCFRVYGAHEPYWEKILRDRFGTTDLDQLSPVRPKPFLRGGKLIELPSQLEQALMTLNGRVNGKNGFRHLAGHSMHDMYMRAGLDCDCLQCKPRRPQILVPAAAMDSNEPF